MPDTTTRLKAAQERRARKREAMERAWTEMVGQAYEVEAGLTTLHSRAVRNAMAPRTIRALAQAQKALAGAVLALEDDECRPRPRGKKRKEAS